MLPPNLQEIKNKLETKGYASRTSGEDGLLAELDALSKFLDSAGYSADVAVKKSLDENIKRAFATTSGPSGTCRCCGQSV
jgi:hypothetical protein